MSLFWSWYHRNVNHYHLNGSYFTYNVWQLLLSIPVRRCFASGFAIIARVKKRDSRRYFVSLWMRKGVAQKSLSKELLRLFRIWNFPTQSFGLRYRRSLRSDDDMRTEEFGVLLILIRLEIQTYSRESRGGKFDATIPN